MRPAVGIILTFACFGALAAEPDVPTFREDVLPILSNNCFKCHGPDPKARKANLRFDIENAAREALTPASDGVSPVTHRITSADPNELMPPSDSGLSLTAAQVDTLTRWIDGGAVYQKHWAFDLPVRPAVPEVTDAAWPRNPVDAFILNRLEAESIAPSPPADPVTLIRRVYLDLTGLPPLVEAVDTFTSDPSDDAYEAVVDSLLASPHFGERWGRHWLDAARYADSSGYSIDGDRSIWPYRDWVINAVNEGMPFDEFVIEQMAGDLLPNATRDQRIATGFHRNTMINQEGGIDKEEFRQESIHDRVATTGSVFLGLTVNCARCHTHKYDPILQTEYYQFFAFYNNDDEPELPIASPEQEAQIAATEKEIAAIAKERDAFFAAAETTEQPEWEASLSIEFLRGLDEIQRNALLTAPTDRSEDERMAAHNVFKRQSPQAKAFQDRIDALKKTLPDVPTTMVLAARSEPRETHLLSGGDYTRPAEIVTAGVPAVLNPLPADASTSRLDLARWLVARDNPLTARVTVNRYWQHLFGRGIVETENDFGIQGSPPSHPALLDWLATEFMESGWDTKHLIRTIVLSATYRQSSYARPDLDLIDPRNLLLAHQSRVRLDAEIIRDTALSAAGLLNPAIGGPLVYPPIPDGVMNLGQRAREWPTSEGPDRFRRAMYTAFIRGTPYPSLTVFDAPNAQTACTRRVRSNTPLQALTLLNEGAYVEIAKGFAERLTAPTELSDEARIRMAYEISVGREPEPDETAILLGLLASERNVTTEADAWTTVARAMLNLDEFITRE